MIAAELYGSLRDHVTGNRAVILKLESFPCVRVEYNMINQPGKEFL